MLSIRNENIQTRLHVPTLEFDQTANANTHMILQAGWKVLWPDKFRAGSKRRMAIRIADIHFGKYFDPWYPKSMRWITAAVVGTFTAPGHVKGDSGRTQEGDCGVDLSETGHPC